MESQNSGRARFEKLLGEVWSVAASAVEKDNGVGVLGGGRDEIRVGKYGHDGCFRVWFLEFFFLFWKC